MLKLYEYEGLVFQFEEGKQPEGAKPVGKPAPKKRPKGKE